ncbi:hypothetical protein RB653_002871 [Dictyostelium firmibasis]|uniref:Acetyl-CoA synthetase-like protein n=1 Tax=Dictyostelium firmibasis TaxID=79012 RepID=A0AAN7UAJ8_9MYCE
MDLNSGFDFYKEKENSKNDLISFYDNVSKKLVLWDEIYEKVYSGNENKPDWFKGGKLNICNNVLDIHIKNPNKRDQIAIISECPLKGITKKITFYELWNQVCIFSRVLKNLGVRKGDSVMIYMPTYINSHIAFLSCARIGATHCAVFGGFSSLNLSFRIDHLKPKLLITSNYGVKGNDIIDYHLLVSEALKLSNFKPSLIISHNRIELDSGDISLQKQNLNNIIPNILFWDDLIKDVEPLLEYTLVDSTHPLILSYTSGTTGNPKCIEIQSGGFITQNLYSYKNIMSVKENDIFLTTCDSGWILGQFHMYGLLGNGITSIIYEGDVTVPSIDNIFKIIETHKVNKFLTVSAEVRIIKKLDPYGEYLKRFDVSSLKFIYLTGEVLDIPTCEYIKIIFENSKTYNLYGQSEASCAVIMGETNPLKPQIIGKSNPGFNIKFLDVQNGEKIKKPGQFGEMVVKLPLPPGYCTTLYNNPDGYYNSYLKKFKGYYCFGDLGYYDQDYNITIVSRSDDIVKVCSEKVNTIQCEETILKNIPSISDCIVVPIKDDVYGQRLIGMIVFGNNIEHQQQNQNFLSPEKLQLIHDEINSNLEDEVGEISRLKFLLQVYGIPTTRSGKKIRHVLSKIFNEEEYKEPPTISNIKILKQLEIQINQFKSTVFDQNNNTLKFVQ